MKSTVEYLEEINKKLKAHVEKATCEQLSLIDSLDDRLDLTEKQCKRAEEMYCLDNYEVIRDGFIQYGQLHLIIEDLGVKEITDYEPSMTDSEDQDKLCYILYGGLNEWE